MDIARKRNTVYFPIIAVQRFSSICVFAYAHNREGERKKTQRNGLFYFYSSQWSKSLRHEQMISKICVSI